MADFKQMAMDAYNQRNNQNVSDHVERYPRSVRPTIHSDDDSLDIPAARTFLVKGIIN